MRFARGIKQRLFELLLLVCLLGIGGAIVVASGIVPVKASSGHWPITEWILAFASGRSIATHSASITAPQFDEPEMIRLGAATFESNCAWCHGSPLQLPPAVAAAMTPAPPKLSETIGRWKSRELFYIVQHGIKFTGMPAWPTQQRPKEIWPVVAFLQSLEQMSAAEYSELLRLEVTPSSLAQDRAGPAAIANCTACHERDGTSVAGPRVPSLNGLSFDYLSTSLLAFQSGERPSGVMAPIASRLTETELEQLSKHFADAEATSSSTSDGSVTSDFSAEDLQEGLRLILKGDQQAKIASCASCHGPPSNSHPNYPPLSGQHAWYIEEQLRLFAEQVRKGGESQVMHEIAEHLTERQRRLVAVAYATRTAEIEQSEEN